MLKRGTLLAAAPAAPWIGNALATTPAAGAFEPMSATCALVTR